MTDRRYQHIIDLHLQRSDEHEHFADQTRQRYTVPYFKRSSDAATRSGWHDFEQVSQSSHSQLGELVSKISAADAVADILRTKLNLSPNEKLRATLGANQRLIIAVRSAAISHQLKFAVYSIKPTLEKALSCSLSTIEIQVRPDLI